MKHTYEIFWVNLFNSPGYLPALGDSPPEQFCLRTRLLNRDVEYFILVLLRLSPYGVSAIYNHE
ncbi:hypothetical protein [Pedosphaera parvula]|uniref:Uncharacterized protein n=1 Tax=Pedosphaera parvula (strain Ellin514) TaxID=320771 RepID=B9XB36_PEDPL|nr:hypothetical protein [Pedosphaera parvula]EEF62721.1 hypothetical protein Cflav_PD5356 [Pedosphaera parvula Ellin514]